MTLLLVFGVIVVLLILSACFSGSETALTSVSRPRLHHRERRGNKRARSFSIALTWPSAWAVSRAAAAVSAVTSTGTPLTVKT